MGGAILRAVALQGVVSAERLLLVEPDSEKAATLSEVTGCEVQSKMDGRVSEYELLLLATKPQGAPLVMSELRPLLSPKQTVVSVMAGISLATLREGLGHERLIRTMPNTPAEAIGLTDEELASAAGATKGAHTCAYCTEFNDQDPSSGCWEGCSH